MNNRLAAIGAMTAALLGGPTGGAQPSERGFLDVSSEPRAEIMLDEQRTGMWTPRTLALWPGHHKLTLVRRERRPRSYGFMVEARQTTRVRIHLAD